MSNLSYIELRPGRTTRTTHEQIGFELGWDHARYDQWLPAPYGQEPSPLLDGFMAGQATVGSRVREATPQVRRWLQLRLHAWLRGRSVELVQVTPNYLQQIEVSHCPITRAPLSSTTLEATDASIDRVRHDAGYAAGNLVVMSRRANHAKGANGYRAALRIVEKLDAERSALAAVVAPGAPVAVSFAGLDSLQWSRLAVLCSFVDVLPYQEAAALPLLVLPPNRLRLFNPVQALQAFVSRQFLTPGWSQRLSGFEEFLPGKPLKRDFKRFVMALLPRVLEAGKLAAGQTTRWAIEDAWQSPVVQQRWTEFARQLDPARCEALLAKAQTHRLTNVTVMTIGDATATEGWNLPSRGYVPQGDWAYADADETAAAAQQQLAW